MRGGERGELPGDLGRLAGRLAKWRGRRELGARIPEPLWRAAVTMVGRHVVR